jgi:hypothetical protein
MGTTSAGKDALRMIAGIDEGISNAKPGNTVAPPPARFSPIAKAEWDTAPEALRAEVSRMESEFKAGFAKYKAAAERDASLSEFHEMAANSQKTLKDVVASYVSMENLLRSDMIKGLELICQNAGLSLKEVAAKVLGLTLELGGADPNHESVIEFAAMPEHSRFEELSDDIAFLLNSGRAKELTEAYNLAERLNPVLTQVTPHVEAS